MVLYTVNELRARLDELVAQRPEVGEWSVLYEINGSQTGWGHWGGEFYESAAGRQMRPSLVLQDTEWHDEPQEIPKGL